MSFPFGGQTNDTCDIYHNNGGPGGTPDVAAVKCYVVPRFRNIKGDFAGLFAYTHILYMPLSVDVRDGYGGAGVFGQTDNLFFPNGGSSTWGLKLVVQLVVRRRLGGGNDYKEVYCNFGNSNYPTTEG